MPEKTAASSSPRISKTSVTCMPCRTRKVRCSGVTKNSTAPCEQCTRHELACVAATTHKGRPLSKKSRQFVKDAPPERPHPDMEGFAPKPNPIPTTQNSAVASLHTVPSFAAPSKAGNDASPVSGTATQSDGNAALSTPLEAILTQDQSAEQPSAASSSATEVRQAARFDLFSPKLDKSHDLDVIECSICTEQEARRYLDLHLNFMNGFHGLLDPRLHTLDFIRQSSDLLLCVIVQTTACRDADPALQARSGTVSDLTLRHIRERVWPRVLLGNYRSVQISQACMIWSTFAASSDLGDDHPSWSLYGHALRIAVEVGISRNVRKLEDANTQERLLVRDGQRCWMTCYLADRSWAAQTSRPLLVPDSELTLGARAWLNDDIRQVEDASIAALVCLRRISGRLQPRFTDSSAKFQYEMALQLQEYEGWKTEWLTGDYIVSSRLGQTGYIYYYYSLILHHGLALSFDAPSAILQMTPNAYALCEYAADRVPDWVYQFGHNSIYTMIMYACVCCYQLRRVMPLLPGDHHQPRHLIERIRARIEQSMTQDRRMHTSVWAADRLKTIESAWDLEMLETNAPQSALKAPLAPNVSTWNTSNVPEDANAASFDTSWIDTFLSGNDMFDFTLESLRTPSYTAFPGEQLSWLETTTGDNT